MWESLNQGLNLQLTASPAQIWELTDINFMGILHLQVQRSTKVAVVKIK